MKQATSTAGLRFGFELKPSDGKREERLLMFRISQGNAHVRISTGFFVKAADFDSKNPEAPLLVPSKKKDPDGHARRSAANSELRALRAKALLLVDEARAHRETLTLDRVKARLLGLPEAPQAPAEVPAEQLDFLAFARLFLQRLRTQDVRTRERYTTYVNLLAEWRQGPLLFADLNAKGGLTLVRAFEGWLLQRPGRHGTMSRNTVSKMIAFLKGVARAATEEELLVYGRDPFAKMATPTVKPPIKSLPPDELTAFRNVVLPRPSLEVARDIFLFQMLCAGRRVGDVLAMRVRDIGTDGVWRKVAQKTNKPFELLLHPDAVAIINRYRHPGAQPQDFVFPLLRKVSHITDEEGLVFKKAISAATALLNKHLREIQELAGINTHISSHVARHSFARLALKAGVPIEQISSALEHADLSTTREYTGRFANEEANAAVAATFGWS